MKYMQAYAEVDLDAIRHNISEMRRQIGKDAKLLAVIKADAYGHGAVPVAEALEDLSDCYAVAHLSEAAELRRSGIKKDILILGYCDPQEYKALMEQDIIINLTNETDAETLSRMATELGLQARAHVKIDTGMSRIGFPCNGDTIGAIGRMMHLPQVNIEGIFTHFAKADETDKTAFMTQLERFRWLKRELMASGVEIPTYHAANSAATMEVGDLGFDMVRSGIATYGLVPSDEVDLSRVTLQPAMQLKAHVTQVKTVPAGTGIGYGWTYVTEKETRVATVPVGYADGYKRALSNRAYVLIHGKKAPIIGRVCMDQMMINISEIPDVKVGDIVTLFGKDGEEVITVEELAEPAMSFNYEFVCGISRRIPRVYYRDGKIAGVLDYLDDPAYRKQQEEE